MLKDVYVYGGNIDTNYIRFVVVVNMSNNSMDQCYISFGKIKNNGIDNKYAKQVTDGDWSIILLKFNFDLVKKVNSNNYTALYLIILKIKILKIYH